MAHSGDRKLYALSTTLHQYDVEADAWVEKLRPQPSSLRRHSGGAGLHNGRIYFAGGYDTNGLGTTALTQEYYATDAPDEPRVLAGWGLPI